MKSDSIISHDKQLFEELIQDNSIKIGEGYVPFASDLSLIDVSLRGRGRKEDHLFASSDFYRKTVRRGLSFLEEDSKGITILRKGLEKFFDLRSAYIKMIGGEALEEKLSGDDEKLFHVIFDGVFETFNMGGTVTIYKTEKANGENAQIGYNEDYDAWVIASKNVSMLVRNKQDVDDYAKCGDGRYAYAILIAYKWLEMAAKITDIKKFKEDLGGYTLIGEYCGHPKHQHLVEYNEVTIYFFAIVGLDSETSCCPVNVAEDFFKEYGLPMVKIVKIKECEDRGELVAAIKETAKNVAESTLQEDAEGAVLYFEANIEGEREIISLCKTKTLEYRIYRKLREKLKNLIAREKGFVKMNDYKKELLKMCAGFKTPKPLQYYLEVADLAFEFIKTNKGVARGLGLTHRYIDFLKVIKSCHSKGMKPTIENFREILNTENPLSEDEDLGDEDGDGEEGFEEEKEELGKKSGGRNFKSKGKENVQMEGNIVVKKEEGKLKAGKQGKIQKVIMITPPFYFDKRIENKIQEYGTDSKIKVFWSEKEGADQGRDLTVINDFPCKVFEDVWYLIVGFEKEKQKSIIRKTTSLSESEDLSSFRESEIKYLKSEDKGKAVEELWQRRDGFLQDLKEKGFDNYSEVRLQKDEKIFKELDNIFKK